MTIDPRLAERRQAVAEEKAQKSVGRLLRWLVVLAVLALATWIVFSPLLSVSQVRTAGIVVSDANSVLAEHDVVAGTPMVFVGVDAVEKALLEDPWIRDARVYRNWPDEVIVRVVEREPLYWLNSAEGWSRRSIDGIAVPSPTEPDDSLPVLELPSASIADTESSQILVGAAEFFEALPARHAVDAVMRVQGEELWATVAGYEVRLGRPVEMAAKALTLDVMLGESIPTDSTIVLIAPSHPALSPYQLPSQIGEAVDEGSALDAPADAESQP